MFSFSFMQQEYLYTFSSYYFLSFTLNCVPVCTNNGFTLETMSTHTISHTQTLYEQINPHTDRLACKKTSTEEWL